MIIKLVRHGESLQNIGRFNPDESGDFEIPLTETGCKQAKNVCGIIDPSFIKTSLVYCSPYRRARETLDEIINNAKISRDDIRIYEDPRLREMDFGYKNVEAQHVHRKRHGWFYYRFEGGESPADCYDRVSVFLENMSRQVARKDRNTVLIISHGLAIRCFIMRYLHLTVEQFDSMKNPNNCDVVTIGKIGTIQNPQFTSRKWAVSGLKLYSTTC